jgi:hypothetical protein
MRIELDEDATRAAEKGAGQLGMSVNSFVSWALTSISEVNLVESGSVTLTPKEPVENMKPRVVRFRKNWVVKL